MSRARRALRSEREAMSPGGHHERLRACQCEPGKKEERQARWRCLLAGLPGVAIPDHPVGAKPKGLKSLKVGSVRGFGSRKARSRVGHGTGSGLHPVFTSKYLAAVATEG